MAQGKSESKAGLGSQGPHSYVAGKGGVQGKNSEHTAYTSVQIAQPLINYSVYNEILGSKYIFSTLIKVQSLELTMEGKENLLNLFLELIMLVAGGKRLLAIYTIFNS